MSRKNGLLSLEEVREDKTIFTPNFVIVFPKSDGDPDFKPNLEITRDQPHGESVNYFYPYDEHEEGSTVWKKKLGIKLAKFFGVADPERWEVANWPRHYKLYEQRKGTSDTVRTDKYLYGSGSHRFRSVPEIEAHAQWLLRDPQLKMHRCACKYCKPQSKEWQYHIIDVETKDVLKPKEESKPKRQKRESNSVNRQSRTKRQRRSVADTVTIPHSLRVQSTPTYLVGIPNKESELSNDQREEDLALIADTHDGSFESFRVGEVVQFKLTQAIQGSGDQANVTIDKWPGVIRERVASASQPSGGRASNLITYGIHLLGTCQTLQAPAGRLAPLLLTDLPTLEHLGSWRQTKRLIEQGGFNLDLVKGPAPDQWLHVFFVYALQMRYCQALREHFVLTDKFRRDDGKMLPPLAVTGSNLADSSNQEESTQLSPADELPKDLLEVVREDDSVLRQRSAGSVSLSSGEETGTSLKDDTNSYFQGFVSAERIWAGDLVRLALSENDVNKMMEKLKKRGGLLPINDTKETLSRASYLFRIKVIFRAAKADVDQVGSGVRVAGDVYRVIETPKSNAPEKQRSISLPCLDAPTSKNTLKAREEAARNSPASSSRVKMPLSMAGRSSLDKKSDSLPTSSRLPVGFCLERVNNPNKEVILPLASLSGRLYSTLADKVRFEQGRQALVRFEVGRSLREARRGEQSALLSLSGLLSGAITSAKVAHVTEDKNWSEVREDILASTAAALESELTHLFGEECEEKALKRKREAKEVEDDDSEPAGDGDVPEEEFVEKMDGVTNADDESSAPEDESVEQTYDSSEQDGCGSAKEDDEPSDLMYADVDQGRAGLAKRLVEGFEGLLDVDQTPNSSVAPGESANNSAVEADGEEAPLREGWVARVSRNRNPKETYYVDTLTNKMTWTRPT